MHVLLLFAAFFAAVSGGRAAESCLGEFEACPTGECVLSSKLCGKCTSPGEYLCPDGSTCVPTADDVQLCPIIAPLFNWTLPIADRVRGTIAMLTLEEKAALVVMRSQVSAVAYTAT